MNKMKWNEINKIKWNEIKWDEIPPAYLPTSAYLCAARGIQWNKMKQNEIK